MCSSARLIHNNNDHFTALCPGLPGELVPEETLTDPPSDHHPIFISFFHLPRSIASSLFKLRAWQSFCTTSFHVLFGLPLALEPSTRYFFTQSVSSFHSTCPYHCSRFCCSINIISSIPSLSLFPDRPGLTSVQHTTSHTAAIQPPSPNQC